jgi:anti-anti-sigma regulatory factor
MMRVQVRDQGDAVSLQICGRLTGCWVPELEECWRNLQAGRSAKRLAVDLRGVTFIDTAGERLLQSMHHEGASFLVTGLLIQQIVDQITGSSK